MRFKFEKKDKQLSQKQSPSISEETSWDKEASIRRVNGSSRGHG